MNAANAASNGKPSESSDKPAAEEAVSQSSEPINQESESKLENQTIIEHSMTVFDPTLLGIPTVNVSQIQMDQTMSDSPVPDGIIEAVQTTSAAIQTIPAEATSPAKQAEPVTGNNTVEVSKGNHAPVPAIQPTPPEDAKPVIADQSVAAEEKPDEPINPSRMEMATSVKSEAPVRDSGKLNPNISVAQPDGELNGKVESVPIEQVSISKPVASKTVEKSTAQEPLKTAEPVQVQAPPGEPPGQVEIRPTGLETSPTQTMEPARLAEAQTTNILGQITRQMDGLIQSGRNSIRIQLNPQDLGQIDLKITSTHQGVGVTMIAENNATGKLLENQMNQLRQTLTDAGIQIANLHIGTQSNPHSFQGSAQPQSFKSSAYLGRETSIPQVENERIVRHETSLIDYKV
jgi:flagellar hook-length control protein FliK